MDAHLHGCDDRDGCAVHGSDHVPVRKMRRFQNSETEQMAEILRRNGCIAVPPDTVYGIMAAVNRTAREKLYEIKRRPKSKAFPLMFSDPAQLEEYAVTDARSLAVIRKLLPGPLTLILPAKKSTEDAEEKSYAVRMADGVLKELICRLEAPVYLTSANLSGMPECRTPEEIEVQCPLLDGILEGRPQFQKASTIADLTGKEIRIIRNGPVTLEEILRAIDERGTEV